MGAYQVWRAAYRFSLIEGKRRLAKIDLYFYIPEAMRLKVGCRI